MDSVALFVDFDDVYSNLRKKSLPVSPGVLAQSLRRTARAFGSPVNGYVCADWGQYPKMTDPSGRLVPCARDAFEQEGFEVLSSSSRHETIWRMEERIFRLIYDESSAPKTFILVTNDPQFAPAADRLHGLHCVVRLWSVGNEVPAQLTSLELAITPLEELLDLQAKTRALFIDLENIVISLNGLGFLVDPGILAASLREHAQMQGPLVEAYAYADWHKLPAAIDATGKNLMAEAQRIFEINSIETRYLISVAGKNTADMRVADDIRDLLENKNSPDVFIIASGDRDFTPIIDTLVRGHKEVVIWGVEGCTSPSLSKLTQVEYTQSFVPLLKRGQTQPIGVESTLQVAPKSSLSAVLEAEKDIRPTIWTKLVMVIDELMKKNNWKWVSLSRVVNELVKIKEFGPTEEEARYALNQAVARGIILKERFQNPNPNYPEQYVWAFRPNEDSTVVKATHLIPERILDIMRYGLGRMEYVAFSYLQAQLSRDRSLAQFATSLDEEGRTQWINFLISEGIIRSSRRPHHRNPTDLVTALTLPSAAGPIQRQSGFARDDEQSNPPDEAKGGNFSTTSMWKRLVVSIDCFSVRSGMDWAPLITLRQRLAIFGREDMEAVFREAQESGDVVIQEYPNPNKPYPTKGASLSHDSEAVKTVIEERNRILSTLIGAQSSAGSLTVQDAREAMPAEADPSGEICSLWLSILVSERIISCAPMVPGQSRTYQVNMEHPVTLRILSSTNGCADESAADCDDLDQQRERGLVSLPQAL